MTDNLRARFEEVARAIWPEGPAHGHGSNEYAILRDKVLAALAAPSPEPLREALARAVEGGWVNESIDLDLYHNDPVFHAVVYTLRRALDAAPPRLDPGSPFYEFDPDAALARLSEDSR